MNHSTSLSFYRRFLFPLAVLSLLPSVLSGCGGSEHSSSSQVSASATSSASLTILWPAQPKSASGANPALIPLAAQSITVIIKSATSTTVAPVTRTINRPTSGGTSTINLTLPVDTFTVTATAFPQIGGTGTALATGTGTLTTTLGKTSALAIDMGSTIDHLVVTSAVPLLSVGGTTTVTATAVNAAGAMVLLTPSKLTWTSTTPSIASVTSSGFVTAIHSGTAKIQVTDTESGKSSVGFVFVAAASNGGPGSNAGLANSAWPKFRGNVGNTGLGVGHGAAGSLKWQSQTGGTIRTEPVIGADGTIYAGAQDDNLYALNPATGAVKWKYLTGGTVYNPTVGADGTIYAGSADGYLYAINGSSGTLKWKFQAGGSIFNAPSIASDGTVYLTGSGNYLYALTGSSGALKWKFYAITGSFSVTGQGLSAPAIAADGTVYFGTNNGNVRNFNGMLYAVDGPTGALRWKISGSGYDAPAIGADGTVYVGAYDADIYGSSGALEAFDGETGKSKWYVNTNDLNSEPAIGADGTVYVGVSGSLYAVNGVTGAVKWTSPTGSSSISSAPSIASDGTVYIGTYSGYQQTNGVLSAVNGSTGALKWQYQASQSYFGNPTIGADGTIYTATGNVDAIQ